MAILRAIVDGERDARQLAKLRNWRCHKSEEVIAEQLRGHWREDHLFSLRQGLKMYDAIQERITDYEKEILQKLAKMECEECRGQEVPVFATARKLATLFTACSAGGSRTWTRVLRHTNSDTGRIVSEV